MLYAQIIVASRTNVQELTYNVPASIIPYIKPGGRVMVPLRQQNVSGVVIKLSRSVPAALRGKVKDIASIEKSGSGFRPEQIKTIQALADFYGASLGEVAYHALKFPAIFPGEPATARSQRPVFVQTSWPKRRQFYLDLCLREKNRTVLLVFSSQSYLDSFVNFAKTALSERLVRADDTKKFAKLVATGAIFNQKKIMVGLQAAMFLPLVAGDIILLDCPQAIGLKQQRRPLMTARRIGLVRQKCENLRLVFGGDLGSIDHYLHQLRDDWQFIVTKPAPAVTTIINQQRSSEIILPSIAASLSSAAAQKQNVAVVTATAHWRQALFCQNCEEVVRCPSCARPMSLEATQLDCGYCNRTIERPVRCPNCHAAELIILGVSVEQLKSAINQIVKNAPVNIASEKIIQAPDDHYHYVAVVGFDHLLSGAQLNGSWRLLELLLFLRAHTARLDIQTVLPDHWVYSAAAADNLNAYYRQELAERQRYNLPPYGAQLVLVANGNRAKLVAESQKISNKISQILPELTIGEANLRGQAYCQIELPLFANKPLSSSQKQTLRAQLPPSWFLDVEPA